MPDLKENWLVSVDLLRPDLTNSTFGIDAGVMYLTTGEDWIYNGKTYISSLLTRDGIPSYYQYCDVQKSGGYASFSTISIEISTATGLLNYLKDNGVLLRGAKVKLALAYGGVVSKNLWAGKVNDHPTSKAKLRLDCADEFNSIHSNQPSTYINEFDASSTADVVAPKVVGLVSQANLVYENTSGNLNFNLEANQVSVSEKNVKILGFTARNEWQGLASSKRFYSPKSWASITLYAGTNSSINSGGLKDYVLTFKDEVTGREFYASILSNGASYKIGEKYTGAVYLDVYGVDVVLDKAISLEMATLDADELDWIDGEGITKASSLPTIHSRYMKDFTFNRNGFVVSYDNRQWVLKDFTGALAMNTAYFPLNFPPNNKFATVLQTAEDRAGLGYLMWAVGSRIEKQGFYPLSFSKYDSIEGETLTTPLYQNKMGEPFVYAEFAGEDLLTLPTIFPSMNIDRGSTTFATLRHKNSFSKYIVGDNAIGVASSETSYIYDDDDNKIERRFLLTEGRVYVRSPEWVNRMTSDNNTVPIAYSRKARQNAFTQLHTTIEFGYSCGAIDSWNGQAPLWIGSWTLSSDGDAVGILDDDILSYKSNNGSVVTGDTLTYNDTTMTYSNIGEAPELPTKTRLAMETSYPNAVAYKRMHYVELQEMILEGSGEDGEINFLGQLGFDFHRTFSNASGLDVLHVEVEIKSYTGVVGDTNNGKVIYDTGNISLGSFQLPAEDWATYRANPFFIKIGSLTFDLDDPIYASSFIASCSIPQDVVNNLTGEWMDVRIRVRIESSEEFGVGIYPAYFSLVEWKDRTELFHTPVSRFPNRGMSYAVGVWGVLTDFDDAEWYYGEANIDDPDLVITSGGGGVPNIGEQVLEPLSTFDLCRKYAERGFFGIVADGEGKRRLVPWLYETTPVAQFATNISLGDTSRLPMVDGSLKDFTTTSYSMLYTRGEIKYASDNNGATTQYLTIDKTELEEFPASGVYTFEDDIANQVTGYIISLGGFVNRNDILYTDLVTIPPTWEVGSIIKHSRGSACPPELIRIVAIDSGVGRVYFDQPFGIPDYPWYLTSGSQFSMLKVSGNLSWQVCINCSEPISYAEAKVIWDAFHLAYLRRKGHNDIPGSLANVPEVTYSGTGSNIIKYVKNIINWCTFTKEKTKFKARVQDMADINLLSCITVRDPLQTRNLDRLGWIYGIKYNPSTGLAEIEVIFEKDPYDPLEGILNIDESLIEAPITDELNATDSIDEGI